MAKTAHIETRLRTARLNAGLTLVELSAQSGVAISTIQKLETEGAGRSYVPTLLSLAQALNITVNQLVPGFSKW